MPRSLFAQTLAIILGGLVLSQLIGAWIYANDRTEAVHAVGGMAAAQRIANLARLVGDSAPEARDRIVRGMGDVTFRVALSGSVPPFSANASPSPARAVKDYLATELARPDDDGILVSLTSNLDGKDDAPPDASLRRRYGGGAGMGMMGMGRGQMAHAMGVWRELAVSIRLDDGQWLSFRAGIPDQAPTRSWWFFGSLAAMGLTVLAASVWALRRAIAPLTLLGAAADRFGRDASVKPLEECGPAEMRSAIAAFNRMQSRLQRLIDNRSRMLAGVSHDLRTPLTLLRLRVETVENREERDRMLATIADMDGMVAAALEFARETGKTEARRSTDVAALLASIVDDMADAGLAVTLVSAGAAIGPVQPAALKRALTNVIGNAIKFGRHAEVAVAADHTRIEIVIEDDGPGIPEELLTNVFEPFFRVDESRGNATGGVGLGLAIALAIVQNHGGGIVLANRPQGGLQARVSLPLADGARHSSDCQTQARI